jgi:hypothetical protein
MKAWSGMGQTGMASRNPISTSAQSAGGRGGACVRVLRSSQSSLERLSTDGGAETCEMCDEPGSLKLNTTIFTGRCR